MTRQREVIADTNEYTYQIDAEDVIYAVNTRFKVFARENDAGELGGETVLGRRLWDFVSGEETRQFYKNVTTIVREKRESLTLPFRCDSPGYRRSMIMRIDPLAGNSLRFVCWMKKQSKRKPVTVLSKNRVRSDEYLTMCSWCKQVKLPVQGWLSLEEAVQVDEHLAREPYPRFTHGTVPLALSNSNRFSATGATEHRIFGKPQITELIINYSLQELLVAIQKIPSFLEDFPK